MKILYLVGGTMGVGKSTTCQILKSMLCNSVFLDGDWCWDMHPFQVTEETKRMVMDNISHALANFLRAHAFEHVIFCWVMHEQTIIDEILSKLDLQDTRVLKISLVCSERALRARVQKDVDEGKRDAEVIPRTIARMPLYRALDTIKIDVSDINAREAARLIANL